jgi:hypothetical protein
MKTFEEWLEHNGYEKGINDYYVKCYYIRGIGKVADGKKEAELKKEFEHYEELLK